MGNEELKVLLERVFSEDIYDIREESWRKYDEDLHRFYVCRYNEKRKAYFPMLRIETWILGCTPMLGRWNMCWTLPKQNYSMRIHDEDPFTFLSISKDKLEKCEEIQRMNDQLLADIRLMDNDPTQIIREYKLDILEKNNSDFPE